VNAYHRVKKNIYLVSLSLAVTLLFIYSILLSERPAIFETFENIAYDLRLQWTMPETIDDKIVIIDIDEKSLAAEGRWPWPRDRIADMLDILFDHYGIAVIGFDMVFAESDDNPGIEELGRLAPATLENSEQFLKDLEKLKPHINRDQRFAESLINRPVVLGYYFQGHGHMNAGNKTGALPFPILPIKEAELSGLPFIEALGYGANLEILQNNAIAGGFFDNPTKGGDGVIRTVPLLSEYEGNLYESLALATLRTYLDNYYFEPVVTHDETGKPAGLEAIKVGELEIPVNDQGVALVPYLGPQGSFAYYSVTDILDKKIEAEKLAGKIVLLGTTSPGLQDLRNTPVQAIYPGVEVHANLIAGMLDGRIKHRPSYSNGIELAQLLGFGVLLTFLLPVLSAIGSILLTLVMISGIVFYNLHVWGELDQVIPVASVLILIALLFTIHISYGFLTEARLKKMITSTFGQYVPPEVAEELAESPQSMDLSGQSRDMTVLFSDVRGFTSLSEGLSPSDLTQVMNTILTPMTRIIYEHNGTIDKYMGDAVMAFWGAPLNDPEHATHALEAALEMTNALTDINRIFANKGWPEIDMGVGLNSGTMSVGNMGSEYRIAYTVLGDAVNLGSRVEGLTKEYGVRIIISEFTRKQIKGFVFKELDKVRVKGKEEPVTIYEPVSSRENIGEDKLEEVKRYSEALFAYRSQNWTLAEKRFKLLTQTYTDSKLYQLYLQRALAFKQQPPPTDWDGVFTFKTK
jgi:adenylate cyclase